VLARKFDHDREALSRVAVFLFEMAEFVEPKESLTVLADEPDNRILECALAAGAQLVVTGDQAMLAQGDYRGIRIVVEDDGPGIREDDREEVLRRGVRADQRVDGQGIGLAICQEIVASYRGSLSVGESSLGGASVVATLRHPLNG